MGFPKDSGTLALDLAMYLRLLGDGGRQELLRALQGAAFAKRSSGMERISEKFVILFGDFFGDLWRYLCCDVLVILMIYSDS